jgi:hypothetical protein
MWYYCAVTGESKKIVFTSGATEEITSGEAYDDRKWNILAQKSESSWKLFFFSRKPNFFILQR